MPGLSKKISRETVEGSRRPPKCEIERRQPSKASSLPAKSILITFCIIAGNPAFFFDILSNLAMPPENKPQNPPVFPALLPPAFPGVSRVFLVSSPIPLKSIRLPINLHKI